MSEQKSEKKVLIMGLDNSGKTSILLALKKNTNLMSFLNIKPTRGVETTDFEEQDSIFTIWDLGGQESYREKHLQNMPKYLHLAEKIIYVVDIQDKERYDLAVEYFGNIMDELKRQKGTSSLSIYLHKFDPNLEFIDNSINEQIISNLANRLKEKIPENIQHIIFKTSIYTVFNKILFM